MLDPLRAGVQFVLPALIGCAFGMLLGAYLGRRGIRAANALDGRQRYAWAVVCAAGLAAWGFYTGRVQASLPVPFQPYVDAVLPPGAAFLAAFVVGFLPVLERRAWSEPGQRRQLVTGVGAALLLLTYLGSLSLPARPTDDLAVGDVVFQTTPYTCAAASIATVARLTGADPDLTEREAAALAVTTRGGTFAGGELRALRAVGLTPTFVRGGSLDDLIAHGGPAVLHVNEPLPGGRRIRHAVALLSIDQAGRTVTVGNPLEGIQTLRFDEFGSYWIGEAVLVSPGDQ